MKSLSTPESPRQKSRRKVSKPLMEKRRRERINSSLETLRLLMLDSTQNEKLKNPKVEKAEILESVVEFLKTEKEMEKSRQAVTGVLSGEQRPACGRQQSYHDGMRSCLLRVSHFISSKSRELEESGAGQSVSSAHLHDSPIPAPSHHHLHLTPLSSSSSGAVSDPVWRPWPE